MKRLVLVLALVLISASVFAKALIYTPTGESIDGVVASYDVGLDDNGHMFNLGVGLFGAELSYTNYLVDFDVDNLVPDSSSVFSAQWQFIPETGLTPSIAIGAKDFTTDLSKNPSFYAVATKDLAGYIPVKLIDRLSVSAGMGTKTLSGLFGSAEVGMGMFYVDCEAFKDNFNWGGGVNLLNDTVRLEYKNFDKSSYAGVYFGLVF